MKKVKAEAEEEETHEQKRRRKEEKKIKKEAKKMKKETPDLQTMSEEEFRNFWEAIPIEGGDTDEASAEVSASGSEVKSLASQLEENAALKKRMADLEEALRKKAEEKKAATTSAASASSSTARTRGRTRWRTSSMHA